MGPFKNVSSVLANQPMKWMKLPLMGSENGENECRGNKIKSFAVISGKSFAQENIKVFIIRHYAESHTSVAF